MTRHLIPAGAQLCALFAWAAPAAAPDQFATAQAVQIQVQGEAIYRFELPAAAYAGSRRGDLGDIRFFNAAGQVVPHALLHYEAPAHTERTRAPVPWFPIHATRDGKAGDLQVSVQQIAGGALVAASVTPATERRSRPAGYVFDASAIGKGRSALLLEWPPASEGIVLSVRLQSSDDLQAWRDISSGAQLVDLVSGERRLLQNRIDLSGSDARYFRLLWAPGAEGVALTGASIETGSTRSGASRTRWTPVPAMPGERPGEFVFESPALPVTALRLQLPEANSVAPVGVFHRRDPKDRWQEAAAVVAYRLSRRDGEIASPPIQVCCGRDRHWRIVFDQRGGGVGTGTPGVELGWEPQQGLFVARGGGPYTLAYGNAETAPSAFSPAHLVPDYRAEHYPAFPEVSFAEPRSAAQAPVAAGAAIPWRPVALWGVLVAGVLLLAAMVWRLLKQLPK